MTGHDREAKQKHPTRFKPGESGNSKGRPKGKATADKLGPSTSAFNVIFDKTFKVTQNGHERELTAEEALQWRTYQDAIKGDKPARRQVFKMIAKRDKWRAQNEKPVPKQIEFLSETDPDNADEAMLILGVASIDQNRQKEASGTRKYLLLEPWVVQAALSRRRGGVRLDDKEIAEISRCTREPKTLRWPRGSRE